MKSDLVLRAVRALTMAARHDEIRMRLVPVDHLVRRKCGQLLNLKARLLQLLRGQRPAPLLGDFLLCPDEELADLA